MSAGEHMSSFCQIVPTSDFNRMVSGFRMTYNYYNKTGRAITIALRNGMRVPLESVIDYHDSRFIIEVEFCFTNDSKKHFEEYIFGLSDSDVTPLLDAMRTAYMQQHVGVRRNHAGAYFKIDYTLTWDQIKQCKGVVYLPELDILLSASAVHDTPPHPYSEEGMTHALVTETATEENILNYNIRAIDNDGKYEKLFVNINGRIMQFNTCVDHSMRTGLYIIQPASVDEVLTTERTCIFVPMEPGKMRDHSVYTTRAEAEAMGDDASRRKEEIARLEHSTTLVKFEMQELKQKHEREMHDLTSQLARSDAKLKATEQELEMQRMVKKDHYEDRSMQRKDTSEVVKVLPAIILGVGALAAVVKKIFF